MSQLTFSIIISLYNIYIYIACLILEICPRGAQSSRKKCDIQQDLLFKDPGWGTPTRYVDQCPITKRAFSLESHRLAMSPAIWVEQFATDLSTTPSMHGHSPRIGPGSHFSLQVPICIYHSTSTGSEIRFVVPPGGPRGVKSIWRPGPGISKAGATRIEATKETSLHVSSSAYGKYRRY